MTDRQERHRYALEDAALHQPTKITEDVSIFVLPDAIIELQVKIWRKFTPPLLGAFEHAIQGLACPVGVACEMFPCAKQHRCLPSLYANGDVEFWPTAIIFLRLLEKMWDPLRELICSVK